MRGFLSGVAVGFLLGAFFGLFLGRFSSAILATGIGFGAGIGIFLLGAVIRYIAGLADKTFSEIKEGKAP
jgi:hypothetical protein